MAPEVPALLAGALWAPLIAHRMAPILAAFLEERGLAPRNYLGRPVPPVGGFCLLLAAAPAYLAGWWMAPGQGGNYLLLLAVLSLALLGGFVDDALGALDPKGWRGHLRALGAGRLTAGLVKLAALGTAGLATALAGGGLAGGALAGGALASGLLVPLAANAANVLDLQPGRAAKAWLLAVGALSVGVGHPLLVPLAAALMGYLPWDLRGRVMLGDAGANILGAGLGLYLVLSLGPSARLGAVGALAVFQLLAEWRSLSEIIARRPLLARIDGWGRREGARGEGGGVP